MPTNDIDRLFRQLVRVIEANCPAYLTAPFEVGELYQNILPYRHHRRELGFDTNQDYEIALTELLSGAGGYLAVDDRMRDALRKELATRNPDPSAFRDFATSQVMLNPEAVAKARSGSAPVAPAAPVAPPAPATTRSSGAEQRLSTPSAAAGRQQAGVVPKSGETCKYCGGVLPAGHRITYCPHCGQNLTVTNCQACGTELQVEWKFCTTCGRPASAAP